MLFQGRSASRAFFRLLLALTMLLCLRVSALAQGETRALLIGVDEFVSRPSAYPSSQNNVLAMQRLMEETEAGVESIVAPADPVTDVQAFASLVQEAFGTADETDTSVLYLSTHGVYEEGREPALLLSDGVTENGLTPAQLEAAFEGIRGIKLLILDACNSGAFIGKGEAVPPEGIRFLGEEFKVLTSSGSLEESWYWSAAGEEGHAGPQGAF